MVVRSAAQDSVENMVEDLGNSDQGDVTDNWILEDGSNWLREDSGLILLE